MSSLHNFINVRNLTLEQQRVYIMYVNQYDLISNQIDTLYEMLFDIRANISDLQTNNRNRYRDNINNSTYTENITNTNNITQNRSPIERFLTNFFNTPISSVQINDNTLIPVTSAQINNASRLIRYDEIENPTSDRCSISLLEFNNNDQVRQILYCGHIFHENSLQEWFTRNTICPLCRYDIRNYTTNNIQHSVLENNSSNSFSNDVSIALSTLVGTNINVNDPQFISVLDEVTRIMINRYTNTNTNTNTNENIGSEITSDTESDIDDIPIE